MAVCNLFNDLTHASGNFLMFSQYVDDLTRNSADGDNWKIVPSRFVAANFDYSQLNPAANIYRLEETTLNDEIEVEGINEILPEAHVEESDLNTDIPKFFQNYFENGCAYGKNNLESWTPESSKNLFWNSLFNSGLLTSVSETNNNVTTLYAKELVYTGNINMHSYNTHQGMGYGEIYCYIPANAAKQKINIALNDTTDNNNLALINENTTLEGYNTEIGNYSNIYYYGDNHAVNLDASFDLSDNKYSFNTVIVLYSIYTKSNDVWELKFDNIPMGIYFTGKFEDNELTNEVNKIVNTTLDTGTSYGLRICTRFSAVSNSGVATDTTTVSDTNYDNMCQLMTKMNENLARMLEVTKASITETQGYKELLGLIRNNRLNVPYVKNINGKDYWFLNGKLVSPSITPENIESTVEYSNGKLTMLLS